jgi:hypothetical protein
MEMQTGKTVNKYTVIVKFAGKFLVQATVFADTGFDAVEKVKARLHSKFDGQFYYRPYRG